MSYYDNFALGKTVRVRFNTVSTSGVPTTLTAGAVTVSKDGADVTPSGGVTLTVDVGGVTGRHHVVIDMSVDTATFTAASEYAVRLSGSSAVAGTSVVGIVVGEWSVQNRYVAAGGSAPTAAQVATAVWQDVTDTDFNVPDSIGLFMTSAATVDETVAAIQATPMPESYNADGTAASMAQALYVIMQRLMEFSTSAGVLSVKKLDGATPAYTLTLDSPSAPSGVSRTG